MKLTPVIVVPEIESVLPFWVDRMGFEKTVEVPDGEKAGFVILANASAELMFQTVESIRKDDPALLPKGESGLANLYVEVDDFADALKRLEGYPVALPERTTFYGMREIGVRDPAGNAVIFAAR